MTRRRKAPIVLVVDDGQPTLEILTRLLQREGYTAVTATNGSEALAKVRGGVQPDPVLMDVSMPGMDGLSTLRLLRLDPSFNGTPVIFYTALSDPATMEQARRLGAADYLVKGLSTWADLLEKLRRFVG